MLPSFAADFWSNELGDIETRKATATYTLGTGLEHQQVGNVWSSPDTIVSLSFSGCLNVFDKRSGDKKPVKVLHVRGCGVHSCQNCRIAKRKTFSHYLDCCSAGSSEGHHGRRYLDDDRDLVRNVFRRVG